MVGKSTGQIVKSAISVGLQSVLRPDTAQGHEAETGSDHKNLEPVVMGEPGLYIRVALEAGLPAGD